MNKLPRHDQILRLVKENGFMSIEELAQTLDVTPQTIRRDINLLCENGFLRRYHGGAAMDNRQTAEGEHYSARKIRLQEEKEHIATMLGEQIPDNASLFMSIGTTVEAIAQALSVTHKGLHLITNNIHVAVAMSANPGFTVMITSGTVRASDGGITGVATLDFINQFKVDFAVLSVSAVEQDGSLLDFDYREVRVAQAMMANARQRFLVVDHTKFGRNSLVRVGHITDFDAVFTDEPPPASIAKLLDDNGIRLFVATGEKK